MRLSDGKCHISEKCLKLGQIIPKQPFQCDAMAHFSTKHHAITLQAYQSENDS